MAKIIVGIDEAGRGALAGEVVAAAVILPENFALKNITDSKKLSAKSRAELFLYITNKCYFTVGTASAEEIDTFNILKASLIAMRRAVLSLKEPYDIALVDGNICPDIVFCRPVIKGDILHPVISAASIVAKVTRDRKMLDLEKRYPQYNFAKHKGYSTKAHYLAIKKFGVIDMVHRKSFAPCKNQKRYSKKHLS